MGLEPEVDGAIEAVIGPGMQVDGILHVDNIDISACYSLLCILSSLGVTLSLIYFCFLGSEPKMGTDTETEIFLT